MVLYRHYNPSHGCHTFLYYTVQHENNYRGYIRTTPFWVALVQQFLISLSSSFFKKKKISCRPVFHINIYLLGNYYLLENLNFYMKFTCRPVCFSKKKIDVVQLGVVHFGQKMELCPGQLSSLYTYPPVICLAFLAIDVAESMSHHVTEISRTEK